MKQIARSLGNRKAYNKSGFVALVDRLAWWITLRLIAHYRRAAVAKRMANRRNELLAR